MAAGLAVKKQLEQMLPENTEVELKWPNDVLIDGQKVAGILAEYLADPATSNDGRHHTVLGIGLNLTQNSEDLTPFNATSLIQHGWQTDSTNFTSETAELEVPQEQLVEIAEQLIQKIKSAMADENILLKFRQECQTLGTKVTATLLDGSQIRGIAKAISPDGSLIISDQNGKTHVIHAAEVSLSGEKNKSTTVPATTCKECQ